MAISAIAVLRRMRSHPQAHLSKQRVDAVVGGGIAGRLFLGRPEPLTTIVVYSLLVCGSAVEGVGELVLGGAEAVAQLEGALGGVELHRTWQPTALGGAVLSGRLEVGGFGV